MSHFNKGMLKYQLSLKPEPRNVPRTTGRWCPIDRDEIMYMLGKFQPYSLELTCDRGVETLQNKKHAACLVYHQSWKQVCTLYCTWLSQRPVWLFSLGLNILLKTASGKNSLHVSEWPPSTVAANVLCSKGWNIVLSEMRESAKLGQIVIALNY